MLIGILFIGTISDILVVLMVSDHTIGQSDLLIQRLNFRRIRCYRCRFKMINSVSDTFRCLVILNVSLCDSLGIGRTDLIADKVRIIQQFISTLQSITCCILQQLCGYHITAVIFLFPFTVERLDYLFIGFFSISTCFQRKRIEILSAER